jgi:membrane associated rhomboid family serine protease
MIPLRTDSPLRATPWMNWALIAANVLVFVVEGALDKMGYGYFSYRMHLNPADPHLWNFFSYAFLHADIIHLLSNMLFLYIFGNNVNDRLGHVGYLAFYLAGAVFAGVGYCLTQMDAGMAAHPVVGASGAVSAITGAYLVLFPRSHVTVLFFFFYIMPFEIPSLWFIGLFFVQDLILNASKDQVAHMAHLAGTFFGFVVCYVLLTVNLLPRDVFDIVALVERWNRRRQYRDMVAKGYDPWGYQRPEKQAPPSEHSLKIQELRAQISSAISAHNHPLAAEKYLELNKLDPEQVLARQQQMDVANQLASQQLYPQAAAAYELLLRHYKNTEQIEQVELMLGLIYARYLQKYDQAKQYLVRASNHLRGEREVELAKAELQRIEPFIAPSASA